VKQGYLKPPPIAIFSSTSRCANPLQKHILHTMRFTTPNAFIMSTFAVLSLMAPVANAQVGNVATITSPAAGVTVNAFQSIEVTWYVIRMENPSSECHHKLLTAGITAGPSATTRM